MSVLEPFHEAHGASLVDVGGRRVAAHYGRPSRAHHAVRNGVGVIEQPLDVIAVTGEDRVDFVDNAVTNRVPEAPGQGCYALLLTPKGRIRLEMEILTEADRLLIVLPPGTAGDLLADWSEKVFIQDVAFEDLTEEYVVLGVHGPKATTKLASVMPEDPVPEATYHFSRTACGDATVLVVSTDAPCGEPSYTVLAAVTDADDVIDTLVNLGSAAIPFGQETWETLTLEAGTPLFADVRDRIPNVVGRRSGLDFEKGCFVGQEVVSRLENRGKHNQAVIGLLPETGVSAGGEITAAGDSVGAVLRGGLSPILERRIALGLVRTDREGTLAVQVDGTAIPAERTALPFVEGTARSGRIPTY